MSQIRLLYAIGIAGVVLASPARPQTNHVSLRQVLDSVRVEMEIRGVSATVIFPDGSRWTGVSGVAYDTVVITEATVFEAGSVTKTFTGALAVQLVADGLLDLDASIATWLPDLANADQMTLRQLLNHTSGMSDVFDNPAFIPQIMMNPSRVWTAGEVLEQVPDPEFAPGEGWNYSSAGFVAVGIALEATTGQSLDELFRERFFDPLELSRTFYGGIEAITGAQAHAFFDFNNDGTVDDLTAVFPSTAFRTAAGAAGAIVSTSSDMATWMRALCSGDVLTEAGFEEFTTWVDRPDGNRHGLGLLRVEVDGVVLYGHRGNSAGFSASVWYATELDLTIAVLTNKHGVHVTPFVEAILETTRIAAPPSDALGMRVTRGARWR